MKKNYKKGLGKHEMEAEGEHFLKLSNDLANIEEMREEIQKIKTRKAPELEKINGTVSTALFLDGEKEYIKKCIENIKQRIEQGKPELISDEETKAIDFHMLSAIIRTCRNLYWSGKLIGAESLVDDIPELLKTQEAQLKKMQEQNKKR